MLFLDTSALLKRYVDEDGTAVVLRRMADDVDWVASELALAEAEITLCHLGFEPRDGARLRDDLRADWARFLVVPVDGACLAEAASIGCEHQIRTLDAIHVAAARRLPTPTTFLTFDLRQAVVAQALDLEIAAGSP